MKILIIALLFFSPNYYSPTCSIITPVANQSYTEGQGLVITAAAADRDGTISKVEFYVDNVVVKTVTTTPYQVSVQNVKAGIHNVKARATDNSGYVKTSTSVQIVFFPASGTSSASNVTRASIDSLKASIAALSSLVAANKTSISSQSSLISSNTSGINSINGNLNIIMGRVTKMEKGDSVIFQLAPGMTLTQYMDPITGIRYTQIK